ncbi:Bug family tripartite tricarboxylate transporter substrate binding protein [Achromobacter denitrificans]|uniref:Bug family tripartite tricarboxylate transporter substrate binding protein n=1 Tax=Achromobacter denitrificans TaxID=32002 RepID=UPI003BA9EB02
MKRYLSLWAGVMLAVSACHAAAQDYPARPVRMVVGFAPGGGNDILARLMAEQLQRRLGQPFIVENRPGASGAIAIGAVKRAEPDGYTLLVGPSSGMTVNPAIYRDLDYDPVADFAPISLVGDIPMILAVKADSTARSVADLVGQGEKSGKPLFAGAGANSFQLATGVFASRVGLEAEVVNYKGNSAVVAALLANEIDFALIDTAAVPAADPQRPAERARRHRGQAFRPAARRADGRGVRRAGFRHVVLVVSVRAGGHAGRRHRKAAVQRCRRRPRARGVRALAGAGHRARGQRLEGPGRHHGQGDPDVCAGRQGGEPVADEIRRGPPDCRMAARRPRGVRSSVRSGRGRRS